MSFRMTSFRHHFTHSVFQQNKSVKPFKNKGWTYLSRFEELLPQPGATGHNSFTPTSAAPPPSNNDDDDMALIMSQEDPTEASGGIDSIPQDGGDPMDIDNGDNIGMASSQTAVSVSAGKRKRAATDDTTDATSHPPTSIYTPSLPPSGPARKKRSSTATSSVPASSTLAHGPAPKMTPAIAIYNMQGTVNQMTDVLKESLNTVPINPRSVQRTNALKLLQSRDRHLTPTQNNKMITFIMKDSAIADVYIALDDDAMRMSWMADLLGIE